MPTPTKGPRLGGGPAHERLMLANLATALFEHDRITTTEAKAKRLRPLAEKLITFAKRGDLHARRRVMTVIRDKDVVHKLFAEIGPNYTERPGGYTRIIKVNPRKGDNAPMAVIELVEALTDAQSIVKEGERARGTKSAPRKATLGRTREIAEDAKGESATAAAVAAEDEIDGESAEDASIDELAGESEIAPTDADVIVAEAGDADVVVAEAGDADVVVAEADEESAEAGEEPGGLAAIGLADDAPVVEADGESKDK